MATKIEDGVKDWARAVADYVGAGDRAGRDDASKRIQDAFERIRDAELEPGDDVWLEAAESFMRPLRDRGLLN